MKMHAGVYDTNPETASEFPHGPVIEMDDGRCINFDLYMESEADICFKALSDGEIDRIITENESLKLTLVELNADRNLRLSDDA